MGKHNPHHDERGQFATADNAAGPLGQPGAQAEEMLVIDAATSIRATTRGGSLYALDIIDGATIKPLIGEDGRSPEPPDPAYQQILKGVPAADFSAEELLYLPRNVRAHRLYGMSPVEQIALTINIALPRDAATLDYYSAGSTPDAFATLPKEWTADQIRSFQDYFDALTSGNLARRRQTKFMPRGLQADRGPPAPAQGPVRQMAPAAHLLRVLGSRVRMLVQ